MSDLKYIFLTRYALFAKQHKLNLIKKFVSKQEVLGMFFLWIAKAWSKSKDLDSYLFISVDNNTAIETL